MDQAAIARALADRRGPYASRSTWSRSSNKIGRAERKLVTELGREPTPDEIAEVTGIDPESTRSRDLVVRRFRWEVDAARLSLFASFLPGAIHSARQERSGSEPVPVPESRVIGGYPPISELTYRPRTKVIM